ncbi:PEP-CTERM sorting domain-containing protein [Sulfurirhabdus autotrophica]|nr:PEP-CTERM sorting domain-containing protein [Sulfurirhabdus autotrophica]
MTMSVAVSMLFCASTAQAVYTPIVSTTGNNFTMNSTSDGLLGGSNEVNFTWDGTYRTSVATDGLYNATLSSLTPFGGKRWEVHHMNVYAPGTYIFYTLCASGGVASTTYDPSCGVGPSYTLTVGAGQVGAHMLLNWSTSSDQDIVLLWDMNKSWAATGTASPFQAGGSNTINTVWNGVSIDTPIDADTVSGTSMIDGSFINYSFNFNINGIQAVPAPASLWLFGSGLLGLIGLVRRKAA